MTPKKSSLAETLDLQFSVPTFSQVIYSQTSTYLLFPAPGCTWTSVGWRRSIDKDV
jgi:hypothetical protein